MPTWLDDEAPPRISPSRRTAGAPGRSDRGIASTITDEPILMAASPTDRMTAEDRAAIRSYLQRAETRLSTLHRVASALLSGAGLMVLLPAIQRDTVVIVMRALLTGPGSTVDALLAAAVLMSVLVPLVALALLLQDLTSFYFHANHLGAPGRPGEFAPRFTLTGLQLPADDLSMAAHAAVERARRHPASMELLVPNNDTSRERLDERIDVYGLGPTGDATDGSRADALFALTASRARSLAEEVAKVEYGVVRHVLGIQNIVLRYAKALLALLVTILSAYAAAAVVESGPLDAGARAWMSVVLMVWTVMAVAAVVSPLRWIEQRLRADGAVRIAVSRDRELTSVERATIGLATAGHIAAIAALGLLIAQGDLGTSVTVAGVGLGACSAIAMIALLVGWFRRIRDVDPPERDDEATRRAQPVGAEGLEPPTSSL